VAEKEFAGEITALPALAPTLKDEIPKGTKVARDNAIGMDWGKRHGATGHCSLCRERSRLSEKFWGHRGRLMTPSIAARGGAQRGWIYRCLPLPDPAA
jgi:hypothetical protein